MEYSDIVDFVIKKHKITRNKLFSRSRMGPETKARQEIMFMAFMNGMAITEISKRLNRSYTTIQVGIEAHGRRLEELGNHSKTKRKEYEEKLEAKRRMRDQLQYMKVKMGSISSLLHDHLSDEVSEFIINQTIRGNYGSIAEMVGDYMTELYFQDKDKT